MNNSSRRRIHTKVLVGTGLLVTASVFSLSAFFLQRHKATFESQFGLRAQSLAFSLAGQSQFALLMDNRTELERLAKGALAGETDVVYAHIEDAKGAVVGSASRAGRIPVAEAPASRAETKLRVVSDQKNQEAYVEASVPVIPEDEGAVFGIPGGRAEQLGRVRIGMSLKSQKLVLAETLRYVLAIAALILGCACAVGYLQIRRLLRPLMELAKATQSVGRGDYESGYAIRKSDDEIGELVDSFNEMVNQVVRRTKELSEQVAAKETALAELAQAQQRLIDLSRKSGMAEVATNVLHNVGNVLNSVNVSATIVAGQVKESRISKLPVVVEMLRERDGHLDEFLSQDPRGQRILPYLGNLCAHLERERCTILDELSHLTNHVSHIKQIVATQQNYARVSGLTEEFSLKDLVEDALRIVQPSLDKHQVAIIRDLQDIPPIVSDRHRILQIMLNLVRNAKQAIEGSARPERVIRVRLRGHGPDRVRLEVKDSGVGLPAENLTRIFAHGFTTKEGGHGFGLHSGAIAARQMGGALWAESEGPGLGATFTLELPLAHRNDRSESDTYATAVKI